MSRGSLEARPIGGARSPGDAVAIVASTPETPAPAGGVRPSGVPHFGQNFAPSADASLQFGQITDTGQKVPSSMNCCLALGPAPRLRIHDVNKPDSVGDGGSGD